MFKPHGGEHTCTSQEAKDWKVALDAVNHLAKREADKQRRQRLNEVKCFLLSQLIESHGDALVVSADEAAAPEKNLLSIAFKEHRGRWHAPRHFLEGL